MQLAERAAHPFQLWEVAGLFVVAPLAVSVSRAVSVWIKLLWTKPDESSKSLCTKKAQAWPRSREHVRQLEDPRADVYIASAVFFANVLLMLLAEQNATIS